MLFSLLVNFLERSYQIILIIDYKSHLNRTFDPLNQPKFTLLSYHMSTAYSVEASSALENTRSPFRPGHNAFPPELVRELVRYIFHGRALCLYYQLILLVVLLVATGVHWTAKLKAKPTTPPKKMRISNRSAYKIQYKSQPDQIKRPSLKDITVETATSDIAPLIPKCVTRQEQLNHLQRIYYAISGFLMKQPEIEAFANCNWGMSLVICGYYLLTLGFCFYDVHLAHPVILAFRLGLISAANMPLLYVFGTKHSPISWMVGWSYEQLNMFHQHIGNVCIKTMIAHTAIFLYYFRLEYLFTQRWSLAGVVAGICFFIILLSAHPKIKELLYELFYIVHLVGLLVCLPALWYHHPTARPFVALAVFSVIYDRVVRFAKDYRLAYSTVEIGAGDTIIIRIPIDDNSDSEKVPLGFLGRWLSNHPLLPWHPGQHVFITVVGCGFFESHPFTVASNYHTSDTMDIVIRARNGFTRRFLEQTRKSNIFERWILIHGPYGTPIEDRPLSTINISQSESEEEAVTSELQECSDTDTKNSSSSSSLVISHQSLDQPLPNSSLTAISSALSPKKAASRPKVILIAGGSGVAFTYPVLQEYIMTRERAKSSFDDSDICKDGLHISSIDVPDVRFFWIIPDREYIKWFPSSFEQQVQASEEFVASQLDPEYAQYASEIRLWVTPERNGRPDIDREIRRMLFNGEEHETLRPSIQSHKQQKSDVNCWVGVCGPTALVTQVRNAGGRLRQEGYDGVNVYAEVFGW